MKLLPNWKSVITKAWSVRLMAFGIFLQSVELFLPNLEGIVPDNWLGYGAIGVSLTGIIARLVAQEGLKDG